MSASASALSTSTSVLSELESALTGSAGLNVSDVVDEIIQSKEGPLQSMEADQTTLSNQNTAITGLETDMTAVTTDLQSLGDLDGVFGETTASSSNSSVATATTQTGATAGSYAVLVSLLATTGSWYSDEEASGSTALAAGSFGVDIGGTTTSFDVAAGDTLSDVASEINNTKIGVTASVVTDASGARLSLVASNSGAAADFSVTGATGLGFRQGTVGQDAQLKVNGTPVTSASNTVTGAISGVTLQLTGTSTTAATVTVAPNTSDIESKVSSFVSDYNTLLSAVQDQFTFSSSTSSEGVLATDSIARSLEESVLGMSTMSLGTGTYSTLSSLGITTGSDGSLSMDTNTLGSALATDYSDVVGFFQGTGGAAGFASASLSTLNTYTDAANGAFTVELSNIATESSSLSSQISDEETTLTAEQATLTAQYNQINVELEQLPSTIKNTQTLLGENNSSSSS